MSARKVSASGHVLAGLVSIVVLALIMVFGRPPGERGLQAKELATSRDRVERLVVQRLETQRAVNFVHFGGGCGLVSARVGLLGRAPHLAFIVERSGAVSVASEAPRRFQAQWKKHCLTRGAPSLQI